MFRANLIL